MMNVSHLLFADDTMSFCDADAEKLLNFMMFLLYFKAVLGLRINL